MTKEHIVAQIAHSIASYDDTWDKLSLLQDYIISTLPNVNRGDSHWRGLMSIRLHTRADDVIAWLDGFMKVYLAIPQVNAALSQCYPNNDKCECVYYQGGGLYSLLGPITPLKKVRILGGNGSSVLGTEDP